MFKPKPSGLEVEDNTGGNGTGQGGRGKFIKDKENKQTKKKTHNENLKFVFINRQWRITARF